MTSAHDPFRIFLQFHEGRVFFSKKLSLFGIILCIFKSCSLATFIWTQEPDSLGCLLELTWNGQKTLEFSDGTARKFLEDGDEVVFTGQCKVLFFFPFSFFNQLSSALKSVVLATEGVCVSMLRLSYVPWQQLAFLVLTSTLLYQAVSSTLLAFLTSRRITFSEVKMVGRGIVVRCDLTPLLGDVCFGTYCFFCHIKYYEGLRCSIFITGRWLHGWVWNMRRKDCSFTSLRRSIDRAAEHLEVLLCH